MQPSSEPVGELENRLESNGAAPNATGAETPDRRLNGGSTAELHDLLNALQAMRVGDFSVRMPGNQVGILGKIADTFNEIVAANQRMAQQLERVGQVVGREGKTRQRVKFGLSQRRLGRDGDLGQHADRRSAVADHRSHPRHRRRRAGRPAADRAPRRRRPAARGRVPALRDHRQHDDQAAQRVHLGSDARGARGRHRGQARRPGAGARGDRRLEGPDRERQLDGVATSPRRSATSPR